MSYGMPANCPKCGNGYLERAKDRGMDTGDWHCYQCGTYGPISRPPLLKPQKEND